MLRPGEGLNSGPAPAPGSEHHEGNGERKATGAAPITGSHEYATPEELARRLLDDIQHINDRGAITQDAVMDDLLQARNLGNLNSVADIVHNNNNDINVVRDKDGNVTELVFDIPEAYGPLERVDITIVDSKLPGQKDVRINGKDQHDIDKARFIQEVSGVKFDEVQVGNEVISAQKIFGQIQEHLKQVTTGGADASLSLLEDISLARRTGLMGFVCQKIENSGCGTVRHDSRGNVTQLDLDYSDADGNTHLLEVKLLRNQANQDVVKINGKTREQLQAELDAQKLQANAA